MESQKSENLAESRAISYYSRYPGSSRKEIIRSILADEQVQQIIRRVAKRNKRPVFLVQRNASRILLEMTANLKPRAIRMAYLFFKKLWRRTYTRLYVDLKGLLRLKPLLQKHPVILIPSHKSHVDYLLLSSIFHENGLVPPFIAAGVNLAFWPLGYIFRKTGAFFIRRSIGNDLLYFKLLFKYMSTLIKENGTQEFFIEGGRSRNGKLQNPKIGLLTLQIDAFLEEDIKDLYFVPIAIDYDRILEENAYHKEITAGYKAKESLWEVVKSVNALKNDHGNAHVTFGEPISLTRHKLKYGEGKLNPKIKKKMITDLSDRIICDINSLSRVTPTSLIALSLLSSRKKPISHEDLVSTASSYLSYLKERGAKISHTLDADEKSILSGITLLSEAGFIDTHVKDGAKFYTFISKNRVSLDYYKNNSIHSCIPLLYLCTSLRKSAKKTLNAKETAQDYNFLLEIFSNEFLIRAEDKSGEPETTIAWLCRKGIISTREDLGESIIEIIDKDRIDTFACGLANFIDAYYVAARGIKEILNGDTKISDRGLNATLLEIGLKMLRRNEISAREAVTTPYLRNALKYMNHRGIHHVNSLLPPKDLEDDDEIINEMNEASAESAGHEKLDEFIKDIEKFLWMRKHP